MSFHHLHLSISQLVPWVYPVLYLPLHWYFRYDCEFLTWDRWGITHLFRTYAQRPHLSVMLYDLPHLPLTRCTILQPEVPVSAPLKKASQVPPNATPPTVPMIRSTSPPKARPPRPRIISLWSSLVKSPSVHVVHIFRARASSSQDVTLCATN